MQVDHVEMNVEAGGIDRKGKRCAKGLIPDNRKGKSRSACRSPTTVRGKCPKGSARENRKSKIAQGQKCRNLAKSMKRQQKRKSPVKPKKSNKSAKKSARKSASKRVQRTAAERKEIFRRNELAKIMRRGTQ